MRRLLFALALLAPVFASAQTTTVESLTPEFTPLVSSPRGSAIAGTWTVYTTEGPPGSPSYHAYAAYPAVWTNGQIHRLHLPVSVPRYRASVGALVVTTSDNAEVLYGHAQLAEGGYFQAVRWDGPTGPLTPLEGLPPDAQSRVIAASPDGSVVVGSASGRPYPGLFRWEAGEVVWLEAMSGPLYNVLHVLPDGRVMGTATQSGTDESRFVWWEPDGALTEGDIIERGRPDAVSPDGRTLVWTDPAFSYNRPTPGGIQHDGEFSRVDSLRVEGGTRHRGSQTPQSPSNGGLVGFTQVDTTPDWPYWWTGYLWSPEQGALPVSQALSRWYGVSIPGGCPLTPWLRALSHDGRVLAVRCQEDPRRILDDPFAPAPLIHSASIITLPATASWAEATDGYFDEPARWASALVPDSLTVTRFAASGTAARYTVAFRDGHTLPTLTVSAPPGGSVAPPVTFDLTGHVLTLRPTAPGLDALLVADQAEGDLTLSGGTLYAAAGVTLGRSGDARGLLSVTGDHALRIDGALVVGDGGTGSDESPSTLVVERGSVDARAGFDVGLQTGTAGYVLLGPGAFFQVPNESVSTIGFAGSGRLIADGAFVSHTGPLTLGRLAGAEGSLSLSALPGGTGPSTGIVTDSLVIGLAGAGDLFLNAGSGLTSGPAVVGAQPGSEGRVLLSGAGTEWDIAGDLLNGTRGAGVVEVRDGASLCLSGLGVTGENGRFVTDGTVRIGFGSCSGSPRTSEGVRPGGSSVALGGLTVAPGGEVEAAAIEVGPDGSLGGAGALAVPVTNGGTLAPGGPEALGTLALAAAFEQTTGGTLAVELGTDGADVLAVDGAATLGGTLRLAALPGNPPPVGESYDVLVASSLAGMFERVEAPDGLVVSVGATAVTVSVVGVVANEPSGDEALPAALALAAPYPNPVAARATLAYAVPEAGPVRLALYDVLGRQVAVLAEGVHAPGQHEATLDTVDFPTGVYLARLDVGGATLTRRFTVVR